MRAGMGQAHGKAQQSLLTGGEISLSLRRMSDKTSPFHPVRLPDAISGPLFAGCSAELHRAGTDLFLQDDPAERLYVLLKGTVEISIYARSGRKLVANIQNGGLLGEIATLDGGNRTATATCVTDCEVISISRRQMLDRMRQSPDIALYMIELLCSRIRRISDELGDQALLNIEARLAKRLLSLSETMAGPDGWIRISQADLAELVGATRESVNKTLKQWLRDGYVENRREAILVKGREALQRISSVGAN